MAYNRRESVFRNVLGSDEFPYEANRYIMYVSHACPWANGIFQIAKLKKLTGNSDPSLDKFPVCVVHSVWQFTSPKADREKREKDAAEGKEAAVVAAGVAPKSVHAGWVFGETGAKVLPMAVMQNCADFGLQLPGNAEELIETNYNGVDTAILDTYGIASMAVTPDLSEHKARTLRALYEACGGRLEDGCICSTPLILCTKTNRIVNNESKELAVQLNSWPEDDGTFRSPDLYPSDKQDEIQKMIEWVYVINNGVYRCGFGNTQAAYNQAAKDLEERMEEVENYLNDGKRKFLVGDTLTMVDIRLFNTLVRMDEVYVMYFKCYFASLLGPRFPNLLAFTARVYHAHNGVIKSCIHMDEIMNHYYASHMVRNMYAVVPRPVGFLEKLEGMKEESA